MSFIGIITNQKNEPYITKKLSGDNENIIYITEKNICNIKNVKFETIIVDREINNRTEFRKIISNCKYLILNSDIQLDFKDIEVLNLVVITYGFNHKSTFTVSSVEEENIIICLQRVIQNKNNEKIEPQEFIIQIDHNIDKYIVIAIEILKILYSFNKYKV